ncbi:hypothetical protein LJ737_26790, partial [Hymenobacter sp. 15J16-1T3B]
LENKLNYLYARKGILTNIQVAGLAALLNSEIYDAFFRIFNGNTQVSATEVRALPMPTLNTIEEIGRRVIGLATEDMEPVVNEIVSMTGSSINSESTHFPSQQQIEHTIQVLTPS